MAAGFAVMYFSLPKKKLDGPEGSILPNTSLATANSSLCEKKLSKWIESVNPDRMQYDADIESRVQELNRYWTTCGSSGEKPLVSDLKPIESSVDSDYRVRVLASRFGRRDVEHIRQTLLLSHMAARISEAHRSDRDRVLATFSLVSPQLELLPAAQSVDRPLTPFDCLLLGQGTPSDRAWIFSELLRQLHLDAVVLTADNAEIPPLVGVLVEADVLLFDSQTGWPIPAAGESQRKTIFNVPATMKDALADDAIFRQLDLEGTPFPWTAERLKAATIGLVGTSCTWAPRSAELQFQWPTTQMCVIYDGLGSSAAIQHGLIERVNTAFAPLGFTGERIRVWDYPESQCDRYDSLGSESAPHMVPLVEVMSGPRTFPEIEDPKTHVIQVTPLRSKRPLQQARVQHLLGHRTEAIGGYLPMLRAHRLAPKNGGRIDATIQVAMDQNRLVADRAIYWMASTQFENDDLDACSGTLRQYAKDFPLGEMREAAAMRQAACLEKAEKYEEAAQILTGFGPGPNQVRRALLARRLLELKGPSAVAPPAEPAAEPTAPAAEPTPPAASTPEKTPSAGEAIPPPPPQAEALP